MERLLKAMVAGIVVLGALIGAAWLFSRQRQTSPASPILSQPATPVPKPSDAHAEDACREAVVLTLQSHSGVSAVMAVQTPEGQDIPTTSASEDEGRFTTACSRPENDDLSGDASPQLLKVCKPGTFVLHITGSGKGVFDLQAKPFPEVVHPGGPLLLCSYMLNDERVYDWVLKYQNVSRPAIFLLGSKGDPNIRP